MTKKEKLRPFLYEDEIQIIIKAAEGTRYPTRDQAILLLTYNHGFRAGEVCKLKWKDIDFKRNTILARRQKGGVTFTHELYSTEKEILLKLKDKDQPFNDPIWRESPVFMTERGCIFSRFSLYRLICRLQEKVELDTWAHTHMFRHGKGVFLRRKKVPLEDIRDFLGHKHISSTEIYTRMVDNAFTGINEGSIFA